MRTFILLFFALTLSSCGIFQDVTKHKEARKEKVFHQVDSVVKKESSIKDQSKVLIKEKLHGLFNPPAISAKFFTPFNTDSFGNPKFIKTEFGLISIFSSLNNLGTGLNQEATFEPFPIPIDYSRSTSIDLDVESNSVTDLSVNKEMEKETQTSNSDLRKESKPILVISSIIIFGIIILVYRYFLK